MKFRYFFMIALITVLTGAFVWVRLEIVRISYDIHESEKKEVTLREDCNALTLSIDQVKSPQKLERLARDKFNMQAPKPNQLIVLKD